MVRGFIRRDGRSVLPGWIEFWGCRFSIRGGVGQTVSDNIHRPIYTRHAAKPKDPITITLPDGSMKEGTAWVTTPYDIAAGIAQGLADSAVVAKVSPASRHRIACIHGLIDHCKQSKPETPGQVHGPRGHFGAGPAPRGGRAGRGGLQRRGRGLLGRCVPRVHKLFIRMKLNPNLT